MPIDNHGSVSLSLQLNLLIQHSFFLFQLNLHLIIKFYFSTDLYLNYILK